MRLIHTVGTDNGALAPRMREFRYGNETVKSFVVNLSMVSKNMSVAGPGRVAKQCIILSSGIFWVNHF